MDPQILTHLSKYSTVKHCTVQKPTYLACNVDYYYRSALERQLWLAKRALFIDADWWRIWDGQGVVAIIKRSSPYMYMQIWRCLDSKEWNITMFLPKLKTIFLPSPMVQPTFEITPCHCKSDTEDTFVLKFRFGHALMRITERDECFLQCKSSLPWMHMAHCEMNAFSSKLQFQTESSTNITVNSLFLTEKVMKDFESDRTNKGAL